MRAHFAADSCASRSVICDPDANERIESICRRLVNDPDDIGVPLVLGICPTEMWLNATSGLCQEIEGAPRESAAFLVVLVVLVVLLTVVRSFSTAAWNATEAQQALIDQGLKRPFGDQLQVPGGISCNYSCHSAKVDKLQQTVLEVQWIGR